MNAYELLRFKEFESDDNQTIDILVRSRTRNSLILLIQLLNKELSKPENGMLQKLAKIEEILKELVYYVTACECIESEESRNKYKEAGMPDIETIANENRRQLFDSQLIIPNNDSKPANAFQMLKMRNGTIEMLKRKDGTVEFVDKDDKEAIKDDYVRTKTLNLVNLDLAVSPLNTMGEIEKMIIKLLRYMWAYSKIDTREKRLAYTYKLYARRGKEIAKSITAVKKEGTGLSRITDITNLGKDSEGYNLISVCQTNDMFYHRGVTPDDSIVAGEYLITKQKSDGRRAHYKVYSNLNMERLNRDDEYTKQVLKMLSDERLALSTRFFGGYIGDIVDGKFNVSLEKVGICNKFAEKNRENESTQKDEKKPTDVNETIQTSSDPDDDFDI